MTARTERWLTPLDVRLLRRLAVQPNLVRAARSLGIGRDRAVYRLARLRRLFGGPLAAAHRGGSHHGTTRLTTLGRRLLDRAGGHARGTNRFRGVFALRPSPRVRLGPAAELEVGFRCRDGAPVTVEVDPDAFVVARHHFPLSARNALDATVDRVRPHRDGTAELRARWAGRRVRVALTATSATRLGLAPGRRAVLYVKVVSVRRVGA